MTWPTWEHLKDLYDQARELDPPIPQVASASATLEKMTNEKYRDLLEDLTITRDNLSTKAGLEFVQRCYEACRAYVNVYEQTFTGYVKAVEVGIKYRKRSKNNAEGKERMTDENLSTEIGLELQTCDRCKTRVHVLGKVLGHVYAAPICLRCLQAWDKHFFRSETIKERVVASSLVDRAIATGFGDIGSLVEDLFEANRAVQREAIRFLEGKHAMSKQTKLRSQNRRTF